MNWRSAMLAVMRGEPAPGLLFVPRLDIWYNANRQRGTLPDTLRSRTLPEVAQELGVGLHSVIPDFARTGDDRNLHHRALGFYNHPEKDCSCGPGAVQKYLSKISGPLLDRIDIQVEVVPAESIQR